ITPVPAGAAGGPGPARWGTDRAAAGRAGTGWAATDPGCDRTIRLASDAGSCLGGTVLGAQHELRRTVTVAVHGDGGIERGRRERLGHLARHEQLRPVLLVDEV